MPEYLVISDASPLIALVAIGRVDLLRHLYQRILITDVVRREIHAALPEWIEVLTDYDAQQYQLLRLELDAGEASAIALALKQADCRIILDERKGR
jgi:predicted nucleic acid-binding protein